MGKGKKEKSQDVLIEQPIDVFADMRVDRSQQVRLEDSALELQRLRAELRDLQEMNHGSAGNPAFLKVSLATVRRIYTELIGASHQLDTLFRDITKSNIIDSDDLPRIMAFLEMQLDMTSNIALSIIEIVEICKEDA